MKNNFFEKFLKKIKVKIDKFDLDPIAKEAANTIKKRTRLGHGVKDGERGGAKKRLKDQKPLTDDYKKFRKKSKKLNKKVTSANKENLTLTGQLLDSIRGKQKGKTIEIDVVNNRNDGKKNSDIISWQKDQGRDFFELTDKEVKRLRNQLKKDLIKNIKKKL